VVVLKAPTPAPVAAAKPAPLPPLKKVAVPTPLYLPAIYAVREGGELDKILSKIEREAVTIGKAPASVVKGSTRALGAKLRTRFAPGAPVEIHPAELYTLIVRAALQGRSTGAIAAELAATGH
jgi:hypothetical protein